MPDYSQLKESILVDFKEFVGQDDEADFGYLENEKEELTES